MVSSEAIDACPRPRSIDDLEAIDAQTSKSDGVVIVPCLDEKRDVDGQVTTNFEQFVELVCHRMDVVATEDKLTRVGARSFNTVEHTTPSWDLAPSSL